MNALDLQFDDDTFDVTFSLSSIEHFGSPANFRRAASGWRVTARAAT